MRVQVNRPSAIFLSILLFPLVLVSRLIRILTGQRRPEYQSTLEGDPLAYNGDLPVLIAVWEESASVWPMTAEVVEQLQQEFTGRCHFCFVEASSRAVSDRYRAENVPLLIVRHKGKEVGRFVNTTELEEVRPAIVELVGVASGPHA